MAFPGLLEGEAVRAALERKREMEAAGISCPFQASFLTVQREPQYIHATLRSFLESDPLAALLLPVNLLVGGTDADFVRPYEEMGLARIFPLTRGEETRMNLRPVPCGKRVHMRFNTNYHRAMTVGVQEGKGLFVFEDDLSYARGWFGTFLGLRERFPRLREDHFVFPLYSAIPSQTGPELAEIPTIYFYGTQALYFPPEMPGRFAPFLREHGLSNFKEAADIVLREFCRAEGYPVFIPRHSLVQHEGVQSTGLSDAAHRSPSFLP